MVFVGELRTCLESLLRRRRWRGEAVTDEEIALCIARKCSPLLQTALRFAQFTSPALFKRLGVSLSADSDKGSAPLTAPPFEKGGRKLLSGSCVNIADRQINQNLNLSSPSRYAETTFVCKNIDSCPRGLPRLINQNLNLNNKNNKNKRKQK